MKCEYQLDATIKVNLRELIDPWVNESPKQEWDKVDDNGNEADVWAFYNMSN